MASPFYYADDHKVELTPSTSFVALHVQDDTDPEAVMGAVDSAEPLRNREETEVIEPYHIVLIPARPEASEGDVQSAASALLGATGVQSTYPVFQMPDGETDEVMVLTPQFRVQFTPDASRSAINTLNKKHGVEIAEEDELMPNNFLLRLTAKATKDALDLANLYHEHDLVDYAEPDFVMKVRQINMITADADLADLESITEEIESGDGNALSIPQVAPSIEPAATVNDPLFGRQWGLQKMRVPEAWNTTRGRSSLTIAILDEGTQTSHPDLAARIVSPYDATGNDPNQEPNSWDGHGTACAGIAAATANNRRGIAGVAPNCRIMPIRIAFSARPGANWTTSTTWIYRGIIRAVQQGADVLSNSWGGGAYSTTIRRAFQYARTQGRGGKGCVVIAATGNSDRANGVIYPAKYPEVLACGASNEWDQRKSRTSRDGETWWGSNYGPEVDFIAPGVHIATTDNTGTAGYGAGDYVNGFNGTSSATPNAAGVAGLVLSVDPQLRQWEVRDILRLTARDLSPRGRDNEHGFGRIDAARAVQAAARLWSQVVLRLEFLGAGRECFMRFRRFRLYNSGLNTVRVNSFTLRSYDPSGVEIDRFTFRPNPGGSMRPGLSLGGGSGDDLRFDGLLLKAHGNRSRYSYRWRANWNYTYWRPSSAVTSPSDAVPADATTPGVSQGESFTEDVELVVDSEQTQLPPQVVVDAPETTPGDASALPQTNGKVRDDVSINAGARSVTININLE